MRVRNILDIHATDIVRLVMRHQMALRGEFFPAFTFVGFLAGVAPNVDRQRCFLSEFLPAIRTLKRFIAGVDPLMDA